MQLALKDAVKPAGYTVALVRGHGRTLVPGRVLPVIACSETWHRAGEAWCALHLHCSEVRRRR